MTSKYIGIIYAKETREIRAVFNPAYDWQLDDPAHSSSCEGEERGLLKIPRQNLPEVATPSYIPSIVERANRILGDVWLRHKYS